jgi:hypothetical protein
VSTDARHGDRPRRCTARIGIDHDIAVAVMCRRARGVR